MRGAGKGRSNWLDAVTDSFPYKLLLMHIKHNPFLLLYWFILFSIVGGKFAKGLGIPYLFLDPVYLDKVNWLGFMILGITLCGFAMAFNITSYINDSFRFSFLGTLPRPFTHFCLNNSLIPIVFLAFHIRQIYYFQTQVESNSVGQALAGIGGLLLGYVIMLTLLLTYFMSINRDIRKVKERRKKNPRTVKQKRNAFKRLRKLKRTRIKPQTYLSIRFRFESTRKYEKDYDRLAILRVFTQNQRNAVRIQLIIILVIFSLGLFQDSRLVLIPAAASGVLLLTIVVMLTGALTFWFRSWVLSATVGILLFLNMIFPFGWLTYEYPAYGLDYQSERVAYSIETVNEIASSQEVEASKAHMLKVLNNWRAKFGEEPPKMVLVSVSGGGQRSALWSMNVLQQADSVLGEELLNHTFLITGASGGLFGAAYYRDLYMHDIPRNEAERLKELGNEVLNPVMFTMLVNDLLPKYSSFEYAGHYYKRERGYAFEQRMKQNLQGMLDHPLMYYEKPEATGQIPLLLVSPTITNDGRKLYISPQPTAFFNLGLNEPQPKVQGVDFRSLLKTQQADSLRFLTALRMSATFPYITPTISLPTKPAIQIADAGISDNYGIIDALIFLRVFHEWIKENTAGVVLLAIRDSEKDLEIEPTDSKNLVEKFLSPIQGVYRSWDRIQTIENEQRFDLLKSLYGEHLQRVDFAYIENRNTEFDSRASLSWRLTEREKKDVIKAIGTDLNKQALVRLESLMQR